MGNGVGSTLNRHGRINCFTSLFGHFCLGLFSGRNSWLDIRLRLIACAFPGSPQPDTHHMDRSRGPWPQHTDRRTQSPNPTRSEHTIASPRSAATTAKQCQSRFPNPPKPLPSTRQTGSHAPQPPPSTHTAEPHRDRAVRRAAILPRLKTSRTCPFWVAHTALEDWHQEEGCADTATTRQPGEG
ncbi:hypothetical protein B0T14DRAFT_202247 [Immersiella caudata]|uniref:Uncharacterized protein n=1 Tax=Immersiella caudata TaxID=314043 RepID=A0AA39WPJ1_9PEZI|nr:hypothetical protein B0T14DRAFT_202247 [Immersiella caudata]